MKELSIEEKAKAYDDAIKRAKRMFSEKELNYLFPELTESEEEKIKKKVIEVLKLNIQGAKIQMMHSQNVDRTFEIHACSEVIKWLENKDKGK